MIQQLTPNYTDFSTATSVKKNAAAATGATDSGSATGSSTSGSGVSDIGATFLNLLVQELKNQDPTNPVDSTAMTGQIISLNQLDQLISINQAVGGNAGGLNGSSSTASSGGQSATTQGTAKSTAQPAGLTPLSSNFNPALAPTLFAN